MTSSLVGSEMCIRDSGRGRRRQQKVLRGVRALAAKCAVCIVTHSAGAGPVSYTHLTLPTICSV
eukprot:6036560-Prorocentrum_lima.AAC.1